MKIKGLRSATLSLIIFLSLTSNSSYAAGPQGPSCGNYTVTQDKIIAGQKFPVGTYVINAFGISCNLVMGSNGIFAQFLKLKDNAPLPEPWHYLADAIGATKFTSGPSIGFRVQEIATPASTKPSAIGDPAGAIGTPPTPAPSDTATPTPIKSPAEKLPSIKKTTITCVKGRLTKKVTAVKPVCPTGYKKK